MAVRFCRPAGGDAAVRIGRRVTDALAGEGLRTDFGFFGLPRGAGKAGRTGRGQRSLPLRLAVAAGKPTALLAGPVGGAGESPCVDCLERRWLALRPKAESDALECASEYYLDDPPAWTDFSAEAVRRLVQGAAETSGKPPERAGFAWVFELQLGSLRLSRHMLVADSGCPSCVSRPSDCADMAVPRLQGRRKPSLGTYRIRSVLEYETPDAAFFNPVCGALGESVARSTAHKFTAAAVGTFRDMESGHPRLSVGGHRSRYCESRKLALLEGLERHAGLRSRGRSLVVFDSLRNLGDDALDPRECGVYEPGCMAQHPGLAEFSSDLKMHWIWGYSLTQQRPILVAAQMAHYGGIADDGRFLLSNSNGCATGSCLEEAILHGLLEVMERDAFVIAWYAKLALRRIDPWTCRRSESLHLLDRIHRTGYDVHVLDARLDIRVPTVIAYMRRRDRKLGAFSLSAGSHLDPEEALRMALGEITSHSMGHTQRCRIEEERARRMMEDYSRVRTISDHTLLYGLPEMADKLDYLHSSPVLRTFDATYQDWERIRPRNADLLDDLRFCIDHLGSHGLDQVIAVEQTSPEQRRLNLSTAHVIVPGLVPLDFGYTFRRCVSIPRLYTVPQQAGYADRPLTVGDLNPLPHMFP